MTGGLTATQAAARLGLSKTRVMDLCREGRLEARQIGDGGLWLIEVSSIEVFEKLERKAGWPKGKKRKKL